MIGGPFQQQQPSYSGPMTQSQQQARPMLSGQVQYNSMEIDDSIPRSTRQRRLKRQNEVGNVKLRKYVRLNKYNECSKCKKHKIAATGHHQYRGYTFCPDNPEGQTYEEWLQEKQKK
jgi:hypothetical protein